MGILYTEYAERTLCFICDVRIMKKVLCFSYAFPPMDVPMSTSVFKAMAGFRHHGYEVDVLCSGSMPGIGKDNSLLEYRNKFFSNITYIRRPTDFLTTFVYNTKFLNFLYHSYVLSHLALRKLLEIEPTQYKAIITWSPLHTINPIMVKLKKKQPEIKWIAQFSDPWAHNPLIKRTLTALWNILNEPDTIKHADFIVHTSPQARDLMLRNCPKKIYDKTAIIPHAYEEELYPKRPKKKNDKITIRYVGQLFEKRTPDVFLSALAICIKKQPDLATKISIEFIGHAPKYMFETPTALSIPHGIVKHIPKIGYIQSLATIYDSDILLLIDANVEENLFLPGKLSDYLGAKNPIFAITPKGIAEKSLRELGHTTFRPSDLIDTIAVGLLELISNYKSFKLSNKLSNYSSEHIAKQFIDIINNA